MTLFPRPGRRSYRRPHNPDGFKTTTEMTKFVIEKYLSTVVPGQPFLLVTRFIKNALVSCSITHSEYEDKLDTNYYLGRLAHSIPVVIADEKAITIKTLGAFEEYPAPLRIRAAEEQPPPLKIPLYDFAHTPLKEPFKAPHAFLSPALYDPVSAFSFAVGIDAMEKLCAEEQKRMKDFGAWYVRAAKKLALPLVSEMALNTQASLKLGMMKALLAKHAEVEALKERIQEVHDRVGRYVVFGEALTADSARAITGGDRERLRRHIVELGNLILRARELEMQNDHNLVEVNGLRSTPSVLLEDLEKLYAEKKN